MNDRSGLARVRAAWWTAGKILKLVSEMAVQAIDRQSTVSRNVAEKALMSIALSKEHESSSSLLCNTAL